MIAVIRIKGLIGIPKDIKETLNKLRLRRKYTCVVLEEKKDIMGMIEKVRNYVAYGKLSEDELKELVEKRGRKIRGEKEYKPFFRLHPPRGGIKSKIHYPKGVLGNHGDKIGLLLRRML